MSDTPMQSDDSIESLKMDRAYFMRELHESRQLVETLDKYANKLERELAESKAELERLRNIPRPLLSSPSEYSRLQLKDDVQHYESHLREQK